MMYDNTARFLLRTQKNIDRKQLRFLAVLTDKKSKNKT